MVGDGIVHVAVTPPGTSDVNLIKNVAAIVNKDAYETRLLLTGEIPKIIAHYHDKQAAESIAQRLKDLGLVAFVCRDSELHRPFQSFRAHTLEFGEGEVIFRDKGCQAKIMKPSDVFMILKGTLQIYAEAEATRTEMKLRLGATLLMGGIPVWRKVTEKTKGMPIQTEYFARLYSRESSEPSVEILQHHMNYSFLGAEMAPSSLANLNTIVTKIREVFPRAVFDDRLMKLPMADVSLTRVRDDLEVNCKLIYLYHLATN